jgi:hypothetical protein
MLRWLPAVVNNQYASAGERGGGTHKSKPYIGYPIHAAHAALSHEWAFAPACNPRPRFWVHCRPLVNNEVVIEELALFGPEARLSFAVRNPRCLYAWGAVPSSGANTSNSPATFRDSVQLLVLPPLLRILRAVELQHAVLPR